MSSYAADVAREVDIALDLVKLTGRGKVTEPDQVRRLVTIFQPARVDPFSVPVEAWEVSIPLKNDLEQLRKAVRSVVEERDYESILPEPLVDSADGHKVVDKTKTKDEKLVGKVATLIVPGVKYKGGSLREAEVRSYVQETALEARPSPVPTSPVPVDIPAASPSSDGTPAGNPDPPVPPAAPPEGGNDVRIK